MRSGTFGKPGPPRRPGQAAGQDRPVPQLAIKLITLASRLEERALQEGCEMSHSSPHPHPPLAAFEPAACYAVVYMFTGLTYYARSSPALVYLYKQGFHEVSESPIIGKGPIQAFSKRDQIAGAPSGYGAARDDNCGDTGRESL
ncbi:hypothetical protein E2C01_001466 [Portunus trituberculatus]|uniref:Uncharacterized protein n=1 Tax=Portunus trituberculatus TaxID=210409 RepID=A0A5B7CJC9_PORTR|nr:hypothetical protein [Portunus trituberculatus]